MRDAVKIAGTGGYTSCGRATRCKPSAIAILTLTLKERLHAAWHQGKGAQYWPDSPAPPALRPASHLVGGEVLDLEVLGDGDLRPTQPPASPQRFP